MSVPVLGGIAKFFLAIVTINAKIESMEKKIEKNEEVAKEIRDNYLGRFAEVNKNISDTKLEIHDCMAKNKADIVDRIDQSHTKMLEHIINLKK